MIRRLRIKGYKSILDAAIPMTRLTVLAGPNAAGKSNVADCLYLLSRLSTSESLDDAFTDHRGLKIEAFSSLKGFGEEGLADLNKKKRTRMLLEVDLELQNQIITDINDLLKEREKIEELKTSYTRVKEKYLRYMVEAELDVSTGHIFIVNERLEALTKDLVPKQSRTAFFERKPVSGFKRLVARIERQGHPRYFELPRHRTLLSELSDPVYHPHAVAVRKELASIRAYYVEPSQMRRESPIGVADDPGPHGEKLAQFFHGLKTESSKAFENLNISLSTLAPAIEGVGVKTTHRGTVELDLRMKGGAVFPARLMSEGTLRLLCILGIAVAPRPPSVVIYEEPENGVNPERLEILMQVVQSASMDAPNGSQFLITTHSSRVLDMLEGRALVLRTTWNQEVGSKYEPISLDKFDLFHHEDLQKIVGNGSTVTRAPLGERVLRGDFFS